jgi:molybdopterin synthase sulfur carrier subunit
MITVLFFASIREQLATSSISLHFDSSINTVTLLKSRLFSDNSELWPEVLNAANVVVAVNQQVVTQAQALRDGDEVAFFPPVTGG